MLKLDYPQFTPKQYGHGTQRICGPEETLKRVKPFFKRMGITRLADVTGLDGIGIPVCMCIRPNARSLSVANGKGATLDLAKASAAMESIEIYHAENITLPVIRASYQALKAGETAVADPYLLPVNGPHHLFPTQVELPWLEGTDLIHQRPTLVPYDLVHCDFLAETFYESTFVPSSNGLASGNHLLEAVSHAICEVVERDAVALWSDEAKHFGEEAYRYIDLSTVDDPVCATLLEKLAQAGMDTYIWDVTSDVGIPTFNCVIIERPEAHLLPVGHTQGMGTHLCKGVAMSRAITEAVQSRLTVIAGARDDMYREAYSLTTSVVYRDRWRDFFANVRPAVDFRKLPSLETETLEGDIALQLELLQKAGFEQVIVLNLSKPEMDIPVARVIIPGMEVISMNIGQQARRGRRAEEKLLKKIIKRKTAERIGNR